MKQKLLNKLWLRGGMLVAILCMLFAGQAWGQTYKKVTSAPTDWSGEYLLVYEKDAETAYVWTGVDGASCYNNTTISSDVITKPSGTVSLTITSMTGGYSILVNGGTNDGKYIKGTNNSNALNFETNAQLNTISYSSGSVDIVSNTSHLRFNSANNNKRFRYFKSSSYSTMAAVQLYKKAYFVTYDANGGSGTMTDSNSPYFESSSVTTKTNTFTKDGYDFTGWNTAADGSGTPYAEGATFTLSANTTLYAQWVSSGGTTTYSVTYNANGATSGSVPTDDNSYETGDEVTVLGNTGSLAKTGNAFSGWNTQADGLGTNYTEGNTFNITANTTLYAKWTPYTITEQSNNESYGTVSLEGNVITGHPADGCRYASPAYTVDPANSATVEQNGNEFTVTPTANTTVTIYFEAIPTHTATFSVNGETSTQDFAEGAAITFPSNPEAISGKSFVGWYTGEYTNATTAPTFVNTTTATMGNSDVTYYAVFANETPVSTVTDELTTSTFGSPSSYTSWSGKQATDGSSAVYAGNSSGGTNYIQIRSNNSNSGIVTTTTGGKATKVTVTWNSGTADNRTLDVYGKSSAYTAASDLYSTSTQGSLLGSLYYKVEINNETITTTELTIDGNYKFIGLRSNANAMYLDEIDIEWTEVTYSNYSTSVVVTYSVTYDANGATSGDVPTDDNDYEEDDEVTVLGNTGSLAKTGYTFGGWNTQADGEGTNYAANATFNITNNTTLYAKWTAKTITGLSCEGTPTKTTYSAGESFDPTGLTVTATYNDSSEEDVTASVTWTPDPLTAGTTSVTGTYMGQEVEISGLTVDVAPGSDAEHAYTVAQALENTPSTGTSSDVYIHGIVSAFYSSTITGDSYHRYYISDDGSTTGQLLVFNGKKRSDTAFSAENDIRVGDEVTILGGLTTYNSTKEVAANNYIVSHKLVAPTFTPAAGAVTSGTTVTISDLHTDATIYYTTDGTDPATSSTEYTGAITITTGQTLKAIAVKSGYTTSDVATAEYTIATPVATPYFSPVAGTFTSEQDVTILCDTQEATIYYTTNGDTPTTESTEYTSAIHLSETTTIKAIAVKDGMADSEVAEATFTINLPKVTLSTNSVEVDAAGDDGTITVTYENFTLADADVVFYESDGTTPATYDHSWIDADIDNENNLYYLIDPNTSDVRTAYVRVYALDDEANEYTSELITFTQAAPVVYQVLASLDSNGNYQALSSETGSAANTLDAVQIDVVNGKAITTEDALLWLVEESENGYTIKNKDTETYLSATSSSVNLKMSNTATEWTYGATKTGYANSWTVGARSIIYNDNGYYKNYAYSNLGDSGYGASSLAAFNYSDGYTRDVTAGNYGTICLPYDVAADDFSGVKFYSISGKKMDGTTLEYVTLQEETSLIGGAAYIFKANEEATKLVAAYSGAEMTEPFDAHDSETGLTGTYTKQYIPQGMYVLKGGTIYYVDEDYYVYSGANKAYIDLTDVPEVGASAVKGICLFGEDFDIETGIKSVDGSQEFNETYNLSGQRIQKAQRGVNIVNGKKVLY